LNYNFLLFEIIRVNLEAFLIHL